MNQTLIYHYEKQTKDLAKAHEELKQARRLKDDFINVAAHEELTVIIRALRAKKNTNIPISS
jgi:hypothetical protein